MSPKTVTLPLLQALLLVLLLASLVDCLPLDANIAKSRVKRGFRNSVGNRLAHGFGKRAGYSSQDADAQLLGDATNSWFDDDILDTPISSVSDFTKLLMSNPTLAKVIVTKFVNLNGDEVISTGELFRPVK